MSERCLSEGSAFNWQNCTNKSLNLFEEPRIGPATVEHFKLIAEGASSSVKVKMTDDEPMDRTPLLISTNRPLWSNVQREHSTVKARCYIFKFDTNPELKYVTRNLNPLMWFKLFERHMCVRHLPNSAEHILQMSEKPTSTVTVEKTPEKQPDVVEEVILVPDTPPRPSRKRKTSSFGEGPSEKRLVIQETQEDIFEKSPEPAPALCPHCGQRADHE